MKTDSGLFFSFLLEKKRTLDLLDKQYFNQSTDLTTALNITDHTFCYIATVGAPIHIFLAYHAEILY